MAPMETNLPVFLFVACAAGLALALLGASRLFNPKRPGAVKRMPYESGMDPVHDTRRRFDVRFHLMAIAFLVFDVELLFLYPWAVAMRPAACRRTRRRCRPLRRLLRGSTRPSAAEWSAAATWCSPRRWSSWPCWRPASFTIGAKGVFRWR